MKRIITHICFALATVGFTGAIARAAVPTVISYQGKLMQPTGAPVADGTVSMTFTIYDATNLVKWTETNPSVAVKGGLFNVMLGGVTPLPANAFDGSDRYLGIRVGQDAELVPRQRIASTAYAQTAGVAEVAHAADNGVPVGVVVMWSGVASAIPVGWKLCDGTSGTPDLRDRFIVGAGGGYDPGATGGNSSVTLSVAQLPPHSHGVNDPGHGHSINDPGHTHCLSANPGQQPTRAGAGSSGWGPTFNTTYAGDTPYQNVGGATTGITINGSSTGISIQNTGSGQPVNTLPPYYALCFIMKTAN